MSAVAQAEAKRLGGLTVLLPGTWAVVPMTTEDEVRARVGALACAATPATAPSRRRSRR
jgi:hypothetical protein